MHETLILMFLLDLIWTCNKVNCEVHLQVLFGQMLLAQCSNECSVRSLVSFFFFFPSCLGNSCAVRIIVRE